jgi:hypothetical protein
VSSFHTNNGYDSALSSPLCTPSSRQGAGAGLRSRGISVLVDAIRSKSDGKLLDAIESLRLPSGGYAGERGNAAGRSCEEEEEEGEGKEGFSGHDRCVLLHRPEPEARRDGQDCSARGSDPEQ